MFEHTQLNPDRTKRASMPTGANFKEPDPDLDRAAVYTFPEVVMSDGVPLIFRGTLRAAQETRSKAMNEAKKRTEATLEIGKIINATVAAVSRVTADSEDTPVKESFTMGISDEERHPPKVPYIDTYVDRESFV